MKFLSSSVINLNSYLFCWLDLDGRIFEDPVIEMCFEPSSCMFSDAKLRSPKVSMKELTFDQSILLPNVRMKRDSLIALNGVILSGGLNESLAPIMASGMST